MRGHKNCRVFSPQLFQTAVPRTRFLCLLCFPLGPRVLQRVLPTASPQSPRLRPPPVPGPESPHVPLLLVVARAPWCDLQVALGVSQERQRGGRSCHHGLLRAGIKDGLFCHLLPAQRLLLRQLLGWLCWGLRGPELGLARRGLRGRLRCSEVRAGPGGGRRRGTGTDLVDGAGPSRPGGRFQSCHSISEIPGRWVPTPRAHLVLAGAASTPAALAWPGLQPVPAPALPWDSPA